MHCFVCFVLSLSEAKIPRSSSIKLHSEKVVGMPCRQVSLTRACHRWGYLLTYWKFQKMLICMLLSQTLIGCLLLSHSADWLILLNTEKATLHINCLHLLQRFCCENQCPYCCKNCCSYEEKIQCVWVTTAFFEATVIVREGINISKS